MFFKKRRTEKVRVSKGDRNDIKGFRMKERERKTEQKGVEMERKRYRIKEV